jgi:hypothetical protein
VHFAVSKNISRNREEAAAALQEGSSTNRQALENKWRAALDEAENYSALVAVTG